MGLEFEHPLPTSSLAIVTLMKTVMTLMLVALWATASNHCRLEQFSCFDFLVCCDHDEAAPHQDAHCDTDGCSFETQLYKTESSRVSVAAPDFSCVVFLLDEGDDLLTAPSANHIHPDAAPMELLRIWHFFHRTALPPRAPSLLS
jgi:hypothetical protein